VREGDDVVLIGGQGSERITADDIAAMTGTISYEVLCGISNRVPRIYQ
jgi:alanine racemase